MIASVLGPFFCGRAQPLRWRTIFSIPGDVVGIGRSRPALLSIHHAMHLERPPGWAATHPHPPTPAASTRQQRRGPTTGRLPAPSATAASTSLLAQRSKVAYLGRSTGALRLLPAPGPSCTNHRKHHHHHPHFRSTYHLGMACRKLGIAHSSIPLPICNSLLRPLLILCGC